MIDRKQLLTDLQSLLRTVENDLRSRSEDPELPEVSGWLRTEYEAAKHAGRTAQTLKSWIDDFITQVAAAWVLSCVFVRYLEDNALVDPPRIAGPAGAAAGGQGRLKRARDEYDHWVQSNRGMTDRDYLLDVFAALAQMPAAGEVFGEHNPLMALPQWLSGDVARVILAFFQKVDSDTGQIAHDFTDPAGDTRFLGDLYQDLSEAVRKKYALLQTPDFVEAFILDRTLEPALDEFGLEPTSLSGSPRPAAGRGEPEIVAKPLHEGGQGETEIAMKPGQRAFEIVLARKLAAGTAQSTWFERHDTTPITELPEHWPDDYKQLVQRRIETIEADASIALIEQPEYKRRWNTEPWESQVERALKTWLLDRLEFYFDFDGRMNVPDPAGVTAIRRGLSAATPPEPNAHPNADPAGVTASDTATLAGSNEPGSNNAPGCAARPGANDLNPFGIKSKPAGTPLEIELISVARLADIAAADDAFMEVATVYRDDPAFNVARLVEELVAAESVPLLPVLRYKPPGLRKREQWEETWELQREEDRLNAERQSLRTQIKTRKQEIEATFVEAIAEIDQLSEQLIAVCRKLNLTREQPVEFGDDDTAETICELTFSKPGIDGEYSSDVHRVDLLRKSLSHAKEILRKRVSLAENSDEALRLLKQDLARLPDPPHIPAPPKYTSADLISTGGARYWALRGKLDVPKERWISFPHCPGSDGTLMICWAGYDHLQQALAISAHYQHIKEVIGGDDDPRLIPLLACIAELLPWLRQWHSEPSADYHGLAMSDYFENEFLATEARALNQTTGEIKAWTPPAKIARRRRLAT